MTVIEIHRGGPKNKEFYFRKMGDNYKEITRSSETYKRKATMKKSIAKYEPGVAVVDCTTKQMEAKLPNKIIAARKAHQKKRSKK